MDATRQHTLETFFHSNDVILFGMTGSGKTTVVEHIQRRVPLRYISLGAISRSINPTTPEGQQVSYLMERGGVWPLETVTGLLHPYISIETSFVLDGLPKHPHEAEWLLEHLGERNQPTKGLVITAELSTVQLRLNFDDRTHRPETAEQFQDRIDVFNRNLDSLLDILQPVMPDVFFIPNDMTTPQETIELLADRVRDHG